MGKIEDSGELLEKESELGVGVLRDIKYDSKEVTALIGHVPDEEEVEEIKYILQIAKGEKPLLFAGTESKYFFNTFKILSKYPKLIEAISRTREFEIKGRFQGIIDKVLDKISDEEIEDAKLIDKIKILNILMNKINQTSAPVPIFAFQINVNNVGERDSKIDEISEKLTRMPAIKHKLIEKINKIKAAYADDPQIIDIQNTEGESLDNGDNWNADEGS